MTEDVLKDLRSRYPTAAVWSFGDSAAMADELVALVLQGIKTASCSALADYSVDDVLPIIGNYSIVLDGQQQPACVIRTHTLRIFRFCEVTEQMACKEGEGDRSLAYWRREHQSFFERGGIYHPEMELIFEEFQLIETV